MSSPVTTLLAGAIHVQNSAVMNCVVQLFNGIITEYLEKKIGIISEMLKST